MLLLLQSLGLSLLLALWVAFPWHGGGLLFSVTSASLAVSLITLASHLIAHRQSLPLVLLDKLTLWLGGTALLASALVADLRPYVLGQSLIFLSGWLSLLASLLGWSPRTLQRLATAMAPLSLGTILLLAWAYPLSVSQLLQFSGFGTLAVLFLSTHLPPRRYAALATLGGLLLTLGSTGVLHQSPTPWAVSDTTVLTWAFLVLNALFCLSSLRDFFTTPKKTSQSI